MSRPASTTEPVAAAMLRDVALLHLWAAEQLDRGHPLPVVWRHFRERLGAILGRDDPRPEIH